ncbi:MAG: hypothetical protein HUU56_11425 [Bdellovibrionaceae bacterium]|nr:hypothetical protein [Pseudobdellovibrionaceae bacterium]
MVLTFTISACQKSNDSFSLLSEESTFQQSSSFQPRKIDILWVIDNSGSMQTSQENLITNFNSFIQKFKSLNYDFHMAVTTTDAYLDTVDTGGSFRSYYCRAFSNKCSVLRDGPGRDMTSSLHSGFNVLDKNTSDLTAAFNLNAAQGTAGYGDERAFLSLKTTLSNTTNSSFLRPDAFLAVIIVSDEDDFSHDSMSPALESLANNGYLTDSRIHKVSDYVTYLDSITHSTSTMKNYAVSTISIQDETCRAALNTSFTGRKIGYRYMQLADLTGGSKASLCDDFGSSLELISNLVLTLTSSFKLNREPDPATIKVTVNNQIIIEDELNGWTYDGTNLTVNFHGNSIPAADSSISITFDPLTVK